MRKRSSIGRLQRQFMSSMRCAIIGPITALLVVSMLVSNAGAGAGLIKYAGKGDPGQPDIGVVLQLALKSSWHQLRIARSRCDAHAADAKRGDVAGLIALAKCFKHGIGRSKRLLRARELYQSAADRGSAEAHLALGQFYRDGRVVSKDLRRTADHFRKAAEAGLPAAMIEYGLVLLRSDTDRRVACNWFERAARTGARNGIRLLGDCHVQAIGGRRNSAHAKRLYRQAAQLGDRTARLKLAGHVFEGAGAEIAAVEGCEWAAEAAARDNQAASKAFAYCLSVIR